MLINIAKSFSKQDEVIYIYVIKLKTESVRTPLHVINHLGVKNVCICMHLY